jgi:hypothetical protein
MLELARNHERTLLRPRRTFGDSWKNEPYGYAFTDGSRGLIFCHNAHFTARPLNLTLGSQLGISVAGGTPLRIITQFPERTELVSEQGLPFRADAELPIWMRPFETLLLEIQSAAPNLPTRRLNQAAEENYGASLNLTSHRSLERVDLKFADAARLESAGMQRTTQYFSSLLPALAEGRHVLAITVKLSKQGKDYRHSPVVAEIVQLRGRLAGREIQMIPVPDARRFGNTQHAGCSWVLYKIPLAARHSNEALEFAVHAYLPDGVEARTEGWIVKQWWHENSRPEADGLYGDSPS